MLLVYQIEWAQLAIGGERAREREREREVDLLVALLSYGDLCVVWEVPWRHIRWVFHF